MLPWISLLVVVTGPNFVVNIGRVRVEREVTGEEGMHDHPKAPDIAFEAVPV